MKNKHLNKTTLFGILAGIFVGATLLANVLAGRIFELGFWELTLTAGAFIFPVSFIVNDILAEVYGFKKFKKIIWTGFGFTLFAGLLFQFVNTLPAPIFAESTAAAYSEATATTLRALIAGFTAYLVGGFLNAKIIDAMRNKHGTRLFKTRAMVSTLAGESVDSTLFVLIMFIGVLPPMAIVLMILTQTVFKSAIEAVFLPVTDKVVKWARKLPEGEVTVV